MPDPPTPASLRAKLLRVEVERVAKEYGFDADICVFGDY